MDWCWHSDFIFRDKTRSGLPISGEKLRVFPTPFHGNLPRKLSSWTGESATKRLTRNFAPPFSLDCKQELHSYLPSIVSTRFFVRWNEHITTDILTLATRARVWYGAVQSPIPTRRITRNPSKYGLENVLSCDKRSVLERKILQPDFFFVKKCKRSWGMMGECWSMNVFFFLFEITGTENIFLVFFMWNNLTIQYWIGFIENLILFVTLLFFILNNIQDNIWWKTRVKFICLLRYMKDETDPPFL